MCRRIRRAFEVVAFILRKKLDTSGAFDIYISIMRLKRFTVFAVILSWAFMAGWVFAESAGCLDYTPEQAAHSFENGLSALGQGTVKDASPVPLSKSIAQPSTLSDVHHFHATLNSLSFSFLNMPPLKGISKSSSVLRI